VFGAEIQQYTNILTLLSIETLRHTDTPQLPAMEAHYSAIAIQSFTFVPYFRDHKIFDSQ
jgi:hypothetical protein